MKIKKLGALAAAALLTVFLAGCDSNGGGGDPVDPTGPAPLWVWGQEMEGMSVASSGGTNDGLDALPINVTERTANHNGFDLTFPFQAGDRIVVEATANLVLGQPDPNHAIWATGSSIDHTVIEANFAGPGERNENTVRFATAFGQPNDDFTVTSVRIYRGN